MNRYANLILSKTSIKPEVVLEIGSRDGEDANYLKQFFRLKNENIYVVEPNPAQHPIIYSKYPDFNLIKFAIYNEEGELNFNAVDKTDPGISSLLDRYDHYYDKTAHQIKVDVITGEKLLSIIKKEIDLCKIDVEGVTFEVLESFGESLSKIKSLHIECEHIQVWKNQKLYPHIVKYLKNNNFEQVYFQYVNNVPQQSDSVWINNNFIK